MTELKLLRGIAASLVVAAFCLPFTNVPNSDWHHNWADWIGEAGLWCAIAGATYWGFDVFWKWSHKDREDIKR